MNKLHEREMLNLILPGGIVERFAVTRKSWENFLEKLSERDYPAIRRPETSEQQSAIPSQL